MIAALADLTGSFPAAIQAVETYLHARARAALTLVDVGLHGIDRAGASLSGQANLAENPEALARVRLEPAWPAGNGPALAALGAADVIVIGLARCIPALSRTCLSAASRRRYAILAHLRVYVCNVANMRGETAGSMLPTM